jgi:hypothetical protein
MPSASDKPSSQLIARAIVWMCIGLACAAAIGFGAMALPYRIRLLGLYSLAQGLITGAAVGYSVRALRIPFVKFVSVSALLMGAGGIVVSAWFAFDQHVVAVDQAIKAASKPNPGTAIAARLLSAKPPEDATSEELEQYREMQAAVAKTIQPANLDELQQKKTMQGFFEHRVTAIGLHSTGAYAVWFGEVLVAAIACCMIARHFAGQMFCTSCDQWFVPVRSHLFTGQTMDKVAETLGVETDSQGEVLKPNAIYVAIAKCQCESSSPKTVVLIRRGKSVSPIDSDEVVTQHRTRLIQLIDEAQGVS